ncbi:MAG: hypothetical protein M3Z35_01010, partial [Nitrospirota bacterium]|nr:hypothetical protein [Nitrospirota bacterium]
MQRTVLLIGILLVLFFRCADVRAESVQVTSGSIQSVPALDEGVIFNLTGSGFSLGPGGPLNTSVSHLFPNVTPGSLLDLSTS